MTHPKFGWVINFVYLHMLTWHSWPRLLGRPFHANMLSWPGSTACRRPTRWLPKTPVLFGCPSRTPQVCRWWNPCSPVWSLPFGIWAWRSWRGSRRCQCRWLPQLDLTLRKQQLSMGLHLLSRSLHNQHHGSGLPQPQHLHRLRRGQSHTLGDSQSRSSWRKPLLLVLGQILLLNDPRNQLCRLAGLRWRRRTRPRMTIPLMLQPGGPLQDIQVILNPPLCCWGARTARATSGLEASPRMPNGCASMGCLLSCRLWEKWLRNQVVFLGPISISMQSQFLIMANNAIMRGVRQRDWLCLLWGLVNLCMCIVLQESIEHQFWQHFFWLGSLGEHSMTATGRWSSCGPSIPKESKLGRVVPPSLHGRLAGPQMTCRSVFLGDHSLSYAPVNGARCGTFAKTMHRGANGGRQLPRSKAKCTIRSPLRRPSATDAPSVGCVRACCQPPSSCVQATEAQRGLYHNLPPTAAREKEWKGRLEESWQFLCSTRE